MAKCKIEGGFKRIFDDLPSGKRKHDYGKIHNVQWKNPLFLAIFHSYVDLPGGTPNGDFIGFNRV